MKKFRSWILAENVSKSENEKDKCEKKTKTCENERTNEINHADFTCSYYVGFELLENRRRK